MHPLVKILLAAALAAAPMVGQQSFTLPTVRFNPQNNNYPFAGPNMRYQQWFSGLEWRIRSQRQIRVIGVDFFAGPGRTGMGGQSIDLEVTMANSLPTTYSGAFDANMVSGRVTVFPRGQITLQSPSSVLTMPVQIPFVNEFIWDGESGVVLDIKLYDNGNNNNPYTYDLEYLAFTQGRTARLYTVNNPNASMAAQVSPNTGLTVQFHYDEAISWPYGQGCIGDGGFVPVHGTEGGLPIPGNLAYGVTLSSAPSQRLAMFFIGGSDSLWGTNALPFDLAPIGAPGCNLLADPVASAQVMTTGTAPGAGFARFAFPMPPTTNYVGTPFYSQWLVLDPNAPGGLLCVSNGMMHFPAMR